MALERAAPERAASLSRPLPVPHSPMSPLLHPLLPAPEIGQKTHRIGHWKVTRKNGLNFSGSVEKVLELQAELELPDLTKPTIDTTAVSNLRKERRTDFDLMVDAGALKVSVSKPHYEVVVVPVALGVPA